MLTARVTLEPALSMGPVSRRLSGSFVERSGTCVYTGIDEPDQPNADERGVRTDVRRPEAELGAAFVRYSGQGGWLQVASRAASSSVLRHTPATKENK